MENDETNNDLISRAKKYAPVIGVIVVLAIFAAVFFGRGNSPKSVAEQYASIMDNMINDLEITDSEIKWITESFVDPAMAQGKIAAYRDMIEAFRQLKSSVEKAGASYKIKFVYVNAQEMGNTALATVKMEMTAKSNDGRIKSNEKEVRLYLVKTDKWRINKIEGEYDW